jgi:hypothetical protein
MAGIAPAADRGSAAVIAHAGSRDAEMTSATRKTRKKRREREQVRGSG